MNHSVMKLSPEADALCAELWRCHERNPINHFEYLPSERGWGDRASRVAAPATGRAGLPRGADPGRLVAWAHSAELHLCRHALLSDEESEIER